MIALNGPVPSEMPGIGDWGETIEMAAENKKANTALTVPALTARVLFMSHASAEKSIKFNLTQSSKPDYQYISDRLDTNTSEDPSVIAALEGNGIPIVLLDQDIVAFLQRSRFDIVGIDNRAGFLIADHLIKQSCEAGRMVDSPSASS